ncbi:MAG: hypothetical protein GY854_33215 [Deltaproteobacteria bacterium]|nr:hypothetical protein [Deltaproteobacteria bacterium]
MTVTMLAFFLVSGSVQAGGFSDNPQKSFFIGFDLGAALNPSSDAAVRSPVDKAGSTPEAYSLGAFLFGFKGGYRFNEIVGLEAGWHEQQHLAHEEWGHFSHYQLGHVAARLAWPTSVRATPVIKLGMALGQFSYGSASYGEVEENGSFVLGGLAGVTLEYELMLGVVGILDIGYLPQYRFGMSDVLELHERYYYGDDSVEDVFLDTKDFTEGTLVHILWISAGFQFEWTFR